MKPIFAQVNIPKPSDIGMGSNLNSLGGIASQLLRYALVLAGLSMFGMLIYGGFNLLTSGGNPNGVKQGTNKVLYSIIGFLVVFSAYWIIQIVEKIFNLSIL